ncbi:TPA: hypothetical protein ACPYW1_004747, partial [Citrobacter freundii]
MDRKIPLYSEEELCSQSERLDSLTKKNRTYRHSNFDNSHLEKITKINPYYYPLSRNNPSDSSRQQ